MARLAQPLRYLMAAVLASGTLAAAACTAGPEAPTPRTSSAPPVTESPAPLAESLPKYQALREELVTALEQKLPGISWTVKEPAYLTRLDDGSCILGTERMVSSADVVEPSHRFADVFAVGDPILARHGFEAFGGTDAVPGGWVVTRSMDAVGAMVTIESKSPAYLHITAPVDSANCDPAELPEG